MNSYLAKPIDITKLYLELSKYIWLLKIINYSKLKKEISFYFT
jgi:hypothetical protein